MKRKKSIQMKSLLRNPFFSISSPIKPWEAGASIRDFMPKIQTRTRAKVKIFTNKMVSINYKRKCTEKQISTSGRSFSVPCPNAVNSHTLIYYRTAREQKRDSEPQQEDYKPTNFRETRCIKRPPIKNLSQREQRLLRREAAKTLKKHKFSAFM